MQDPYPDIRIISTIGVICLLLSQIIVIYNVIISLRRGIEAPSNPWDANTLEWQAASPPPHGNFSPYPTVYRGAYEYSFPGRESDAYPQNEE